MSRPTWSFLALVVIGLPGLIGPGCATPSDVGTAEEEDRALEERLMREQMLVKRARVEPRGAVVIPVNSRYDIGYAAGIKGQIEAVEKGAFFGLEFDYAQVDTDDPVQTPLVVTPEAEFAGADTEQLMEEYERYQFLLTFDYDIPLGPGLYYPSFRVGLGLGLAIITAEEAPGARSNFHFHESYNFVAQPTLGFRFPIHEHLAFFLDGEFNYIPRVQFDGEFRPQNRDVEIGDDVEMSTINVFAGLSFQW